MLASCEICALCAIVPPAFIADVGVIFLRKVGVPEPWPKRVSIVVAFIVSAHFVVHTAAAFLMGAAAAAPAADLLVAVTTQPFFQINLVLQPNVMSCVSVIIRALCVACVSVVLDFC